MSHLYVPQSFGAAPAAHSVALSRSNPKVRGCAGNSYFDRDTAVGCRDEMQFLTDKPPCSDRLPYRHAPLEQHCAGNLSYQTQLCNMFRP